MPVRQKTSISRDVNVQVLQNQSQNLNVRNLITVNWNPSDANLTKVLNEIAAPSFNVSKSDKTVYADISWALMQGKKEVFAIGIRPFRLGTERLRNWVFMIRIFF